MSLPQRSYGTPCSSQYAYSASRPSVQSWAFSEPGRVVDARVHDAAVVARLVRGDLVLALEDQDAGVGVALQQLAGGGEAEDARADDHDVPGPHQWIAGSATPPAPCRKSKSQPSLAWVTCWAKSWA